ncbi:MAG: hypothetical protein KJ970_08030 [Candidatus Eisenbacteria bacterium]|uniref:DUF4252 domain-containing protein n=1 Tax=Eiseniibacteriota bacterium TaxID=2212470 RepID=A0A948W692_UNCEI|nr:hypothetical protein [Candidatus Eisenbacteria bacterium]MBU1949862.1 hypothetical protein [Candidatus Eisenbacteria bacterium]MBU2690865.1 hypothetical protein [Candidatus Eisenbacteria bacterium]
MKRFTGLMLIGILACGLFFALGTATADEILDQINEAMELYKQGDYSGAVSGLDFAAMQIRELQAARAAEALPAALPGWQAEEAETSSMSGAMFGGGISAERTYTKDDAEVNIQLISESPMLQGIMMMFNNPMVMSSSGKKLKQIKGQKAAWEYNPEDRSGEIILVAHNVVMITVKGSNVDESELLAYAEAIDFDLIGKLVSGN